MIDETDADAPIRRMERQRLATLAVGSAEIIAFLLFAHWTLMSLDPLGEADSILTIGLAALPIVLLTLPGLLLAWLGRAPRLALALVLAAIPVATLGWIEA